MEVHNAPYVGVLLRQGRPAASVSLTRLPGVIHIAEYGAMTGQDPLVTLCLASETPHQLLAEDLTGALIVGGYSSPAITERRCRISFESASVLPFVLDPHDEAKYRCSNKLQLVLSWEKEQLQPGVAYPIEVAPKGAAVQYRGPFAEAIGLEYGVLTLTQTDPTGKCEGVLRLVEERDGEKLPNSLALYRFGRLIGKAELLPVG